MDSETLLRQTREKHRKFLRSIFWRDVREVGASLLVAAFFYYVGQRPAEGWPLYAAAALMTCLALFFLLDRAIQWRTVRAFGDSAKGTIERALHQVNHRIWLLENVFWWYLLPCIMAYALVMAHAIAKRSSRGPVPHPRTITAVVVGLGVGVMVFCFVHWLNRWAVSKYLVPRRDELMAVARELS